MATESGTRQFATFFIDKLMFGVEVIHVQEVLRYQEMTRVLLAPEVIGGLINLRGQIVMAIDMRQRLELPPEQPGPQAAEQVLDLEQRVDLGRAEPDARQFREFGVRVDDIGLALARPDDRHVQPVAQVLDVATRHPGRHVPRRQTFDRPLEVAQHVEGALHQDVEPGRIVQVAQRIELDPPDTMRGTPGSLALRSSSRWAQSLWRNRTTVAPWPAAPMAPA
jgi:chemotaxis signal transduction protein